MCGFPGNSSVLGKVNMYVVFRMGVTDFLAGSDAENNAGTVGCISGTMVVGWRPLVFWGNVMCWRPYCRAF